MRFSSLVMLAFCSNARHFGEAEAVEKTANNIRRVRSRKEKRLSPLDLEHVRGRDLQQGTPETGTSHWKPAKPTRHRKPHSKPHSKPRAKPTKPYSNPTTQPSASPSDSPSEAPSASPSATPSATPSVSPSATPSAAPSDSPSATPSEEPSASPSATPSASPSEEPSASPSESPSEAPSASPSATPSASPSESPSESPSTSPSATPSTSPSKQPSSEPTPAECSTYVADISITLPNDSTNKDIDIFFLFDDTGSFSGFGELVADVFDEIVADLQSLLPSVTLGYGVGRFEDYGGPGTDFTIVDVPDPCNYCDDVGRPFLLNQPILTVDDAGGQATLESLISEALGRSAPSSGNDAPESAIAEGLFQVATGIGFDGDGDGSTTGIDGLQIAGALATQQSPDESGDVPSFDTLVATVMSSGNIGGVGYRSQALKLVLLATDICSIAAFPPFTIPSEISSPFGTEMTSDLVCSDTIGSERFGFVSNALSAADNTIENAVVPLGAGTVQGTVDALVEKGIRVLGLSTDGGAVPPGSGPDFDPAVFLSSMARLTGAVSEAGDPLVFDIDYAENLNDTIVDAVTSAAAVPIDVGVSSTCASADVVEVVPPVEVDVGPGETASFAVTLKSNDPPAAEMCELNLIDVSSGVKLSSIPVSVNGCTIVVGGPQ